MPQEIKWINLGGVNCYLVGSQNHWMLIDTGYAPRRSLLLQELDKAGCRPDNLKLIILTHGDVDHAANAAFLRAKFGAKIAMHPDDAGMVENGNMGWNRKKNPDRIVFPGSLMILMGSLSSWLNPANRFEKFKPDLFLVDGQDLSEFGLEARVMVLPGHSKGSIGVLTAGGDLFCGDLLWNIRKPGLHFLVDDMSALKTSLQKLRGLNIRTLHPGHGSPFSMDQLIERGLL